MRLIDADRLKEVFRRNTGHDYSELIDIQPTVDVLDKIRAEIEQEYKNESEHPYGQGLRRAIEIIDKYRNEVNHEMS